MPFIENISFANAAAGYHFDPGPSGVLIQIVDPDAEFPCPAYAFDRVVQLRFADTEDAGNAEAISPLQANTLVAALLQALREGRNVVVHCHAGLCRSGAVAEVGGMMGFHDTGVFRAPNLLVKQRLIEAASETFNSMVTASR